MRILALATVLAIVTIHVAAASPVHPAPLPPLAASPLGALVAAGYALRRRRKR